MKNLMLAACLITATLGISSAHAGGKAYQYMSDVKMSEAGCKAHISHVADRFQLKEDAQEANGDIGLSSDGERAGIGYYDRDGVCHVYVF